MTLPKRKRGFARLSPERRKEIAALGGKAAWQQGKAHKFTTEEAIRAGEKGGGANTGKRIRQKGGTV